MTTAILALVATLLFLIGAVLFVFVSIVTDLACPTAAQERARADAEALIAAANRELTQRPRLQFSPTPYHLEHQA